MVPIWFYPKWLSTIANFLPFKYINYASIELYLGRTPPSAAPRVMIMQLMWIALLFGIERLLWYPARRTIVIQGG